MLVSVGVQLVYVLKFFHWEMGYMSTMDIQHDRAGFYICWGCMVWVPSVYTCHTLFLTNHPYQLGLPLTVRPAPSRPAAARGLSCARASHALF